MTLGQKIKMLRKQRQMTLQEIGDLWGISRSSVAGWESGDSRPDPGKLPLLARTLGTSVDDLLSDQPPSPLPPALKRKWDDYVDANVLEQKAKDGLPLISWVQAGEWSDIVDNFQPGDAEEWIPCPFNHGPQAFVLKVVGESMFNPGGEKSYAPGEFIAVDPRAEPQHRRMVVAKIGGEEKATFKQLLIEPDGYWLQALNPSWPNRIMPMHPDSHIVGVVIGKWTPE